MPKETFFNLPPEKRERILDVAINAFAENDYQNVSVSYLVDEAGVAKGSFYQYFEDKKDLYLYLLQLASEEKLSYLFDQAPPDPEMGIFAYIRWLFQTGARFQLSHPRLSQVAYRALYTDAPFREEIMQQAESTAGSYYEQFVAQAIARGEVDPNVDPSTMLFVLGTLLNEFGNYLMARLGLDPQRLLAEGLSAVDQAVMNDVIDDFIYVLQYGLGSR